MKKTILYILLFFVYLFNVIDLIVTFIGINKFGFEAEANTNLIFLIKNYGWVLTSFFKIFGVLIFSMPMIGLIKYSKNEKNLIIPFLGLLFLIIVYNYIIINWLLIL